MGRGPLPVRPGTAPRTMHPNVFALGAIALWASLASLGVALNAVPPFLLTGMALLIGSLPAWPAWRRWRVPAPTLAIGVAGLFGFHFLLFVALRHAPPVQANLVNYLWPLLIVLLAPLFVPSVRLRPLHVVAAVIGFAGAALAIAGPGDLGGGWRWGYLAALGSALVWAVYSLMTRRLASAGRGSPTAAVGGFCAAAGLLSLCCHLLLEPRTALSAGDLGLIALMGIGPMGAAFYLWDRALKHGDPRIIGVLSYLTPLASTALLIAVTDGRFTTRLLIAAALVSAAALVAMWAGRAAGPGPG